MSNQIKILLSRFLTRFGDQAWDFAIPLVLISLFPGQLQSVAGYYLVSKIAQFFINPIVLRWIDHLSRKRIYQLGIGSQTISVLITWLIILFFSHDLGLLHDFVFWTVYSALALVGVIGSLGATLMEISVGYDLAADQIQRDELPLFNSRLKRVDLITEVTAPVFAGLILMMPQMNGWNVGFSLVATLNFLTFIPEYLLLSSIKGIDQKKTIQSEGLQTNPIQEFKAGFKYFKDQSFVIPMLAYAFLWLSVLSPHGVLLAGYLKDSGHISELNISIFRGFGAFFGMVPTFVFPILNKNFGLVKTSQILLGFQTACVLIGALAFQLGGSNALIIFLIMILFSRIGLYGFSIAESEARQLFIPAHLRGRINGVGVSLTSFATLILFGLGTLLPQSSDFSSLVWLSAISVLIGFLVLLKWKKLSN